MQNYPLAVTNFWGNADNNYGFGTSDISDNVQNVTNSFNDMNVYNNTGGYNNISSYNNLPNYGVTPNYTINPDNDIENNGFTDTQPKRTVYQSLSGFAPDNQRWYENNPQKDSFNYVQDNYETNQLVNDCLKSDRFRNFMDYLYQPGVEGRGYEDNPNKIDQPTNSGLSKSLYNGIRKNIPEIAKNYPADLDKLTQEQIENVMCQGIYKPQHVETINNDRFAKTYWDLVVNHNPEKTSIPWIQQSVNEVTNGNIKVDGKMGTSSISAVNNMNENQLKLLNNSINDRRRQYFEEQDSPRFKRGLLNRNKRLKW